MWSISLKNVPRRKGLFEKSHLRRTPFPTIESALGYSGRGMVLRWGIQGHFHRSLCPFRGMVFGTISQSAQKQRISLSCGAKSQAVADTLTAFAPAHADVFPKPYPVRLKIIRARNITLC
jgi:hypothetical protein